LEFGSEENKEAYGKVIIELFNDLCPRACDNFIKLCMGGESSSGVPLHYLNCPVHRVVKDGWVQCGDILDGSGTHSISAVGTQLEDECFSVDFGAPFGGIVGYANTGPHSNGSQFFITLGSCGWMNGSKVGFGRVLQGYEVLHQINSAPLKNERPEPPIRIVHCHKY
jgi:cyclophilin family peptidyl-prolyl cis-trans isomerase